MTTRWFGLLLVAGCATSEAAPKPKGKPTAPPTMVLAAVNLADDCPDPVPAPPKVKATRAPVIMREFAAPLAPAAKPGKFAKRPAAPGAGTPGAVAAGCDQSTLQVTFTAPTGAKEPVPVAITKVELLDAHGKVLQTLKARTPQHFAHDQYVVWNELLAPAATERASYALSGPDWDKLGGRWAAHDAKVQVRVSATIGEATQKVTTQAIVPARVAVPLPT